MYIFQENQNVHNCSSNSYLTNDNSRMIFRQFAEELKHLLNYFIDEQEYNSSERTLKSMKRMIEELILMVSINDTEEIEVQKENFKIRDLCDEVYNIMSRQIEDKKLDYIQAITPELENVTINTERATIKQIMLSLLANALMNSNQGQIKIEWMFGTETNSQIKVGISDEGPPLKNDISKRPVKACAKSEDSNLTLSKALVDRLGGSLWSTTDKKNGNTVYFVFDVEWEQEDSIDENMEISDYSSSKDWVRAIPSMSCNNTPFKKKMILIEEEVKLVNAKDKKCCPNILLVDDNYFNIEVLQSLIQVQLNLDWDCAFNGLEAVNKVKDRYRKTCCNNYYKFIFMDVNMPIMDGYVASSKIKGFYRTNPIAAPSVMSSNNLARNTDKSYGKEGTKIFAVTAQKEVIENEQRLFDGIILKPISIDGLRIVLKV